MTNNINGYLSAMDRRRFLKLGVGASLLSTFPFQTAQAKNSIQMLIY